ncbi:MAG: 4-deoxy-4-formamido-L-arabinose-phosphoundecaprenol deformylase [Xanthomonadales bacterium]|nr:4-deoxy-4-formamido-L-arabinose-phosphoundecaprenol deformylase [Xanthomonadales bacterium]
MKQVVLKVDVDTYHGTLHGVPALLDLFARFDVKATFLFSVGPDNTGRAIRRIFRKGFLQKVGRTSVVSHYGVSTLMNGVLKPGPHIGKRAGHIMRQVASAGHEVGIHCYDHVRWQDFVAARDADWTRREMEKALASFKQALRTSPETIGAAGWQLNSHVIGFEEQMGFEYASDVRGRQPFLPMMGGKRSSCVQLPTTLPTLDEIIGSDGIDSLNCWKSILEKSRDSLPNGHVYTLHAELEGMKLMPAMEKLLEQWRLSGFECVTLRQLYASLDKSSLPECEIEMGELEGRSGLLALQAA